MSNTVIKIENLLAQASRLSANKAGLCLHYLNHTRLPARQGFTGFKDDTDSLVAG